MIDVVHPPAISPPIDPIDNWHVPNLDLVPNFGKPGYEHNPDANVNSGWLKNFPGGEGIVYAFQSLKR